MRIIRLAAAVAFAAVVAGCSTHHTSTPQHHAAVASQHPVHASHVAAKPTTAPDPYVAYEQQAVAAGVPAWDAQQAEEFSSALCGTDTAARTDNIATDWASVKGGLFSKVDMLNNVKALLDAYCPARATAVLALY